ncbi:MAG TPA: oligopeptide:H+ symporter [Kofleriaceae bacterium]|jgi:POT family proton-dependent oligopeptide transporter|nr:oligopeptide:H+ symporter [Kofleriaceae bacterium]
MPTDDDDRAFFGHPRGLSTLFFTEMWERLSYYGSRAFLVIYMTKPAALGGRAMSDGTAATVMALYLSTVYLLSLPGGWIADRFLGQRKSVTIGGIGITLGNAMLAMNDALFYPGLVMICLGTGFLKPNVSTIVGQLYKPDDIRRDAGFTVYYMGINIGAGAAPLIGMFIAQSENFRHFLQGHGLDPNLCWKIGFALVALGMAFGVVQYVLGSKKLGEAGLHPTIPSDPKRAARDRSVLVAIVVGLFGLVGIAVGINAFIVPLSKGVLSVAFGIGLAIAAVAIFVGFYKTARDAGERKRVTAMIPLFLGSIVFFGVFEQASTTLSLFAERLVNRTYLGMHIVASAYQFINSAFIILLASVFAWMWLRLAKAGKEPSTVNKFGFGLVFTALSFVVMLPSLATINHVDGINADYLFAFPHRTVSANYLVALYFFSTCAELCISPVGLSSMSKLAPPRIAGMVMGTWFLGTAIGNFLAGQAAQLSATHGYAFLFWTLIITSLVFATAMFLVAPPIKRMLAGDRVELPKAEVKS